MKVCILAAGQGTRMGVFSDVVHKALLPVGNKAVISRIIEYFDRDTEFVIAVGHRGEQVRDYLQIAHPDAKLTYVEVDNFSQPGSGPGYSLACCKDQLQAPFIFTSCDTLIPSPLPQMEANWVAVHEISNPELWCTVASENSIVSELYYKTKQGTNLGFVGLARVQDYHAFWKGLCDDKTLVGGELQVNNGLSALISKGLQSIELDWLDTGNELSFRETSKRFDKNFSFEGKQTDITYRIGDSIIKWFPERAVAKRRFDRAKGNQPFFGTVIDQIGNYYSYQFVEGEVLATQLNYSSVKTFLEWTQQHFWRSVPCEPNLWQSELKAFYIRKTMDRLNLFLKNTPVAQDLENRSLIINLLECRPVRDLLEENEKHILSGGTASTFHGDLHADNVVVTSRAGRYVLIDWRDSFGSQTDFGDRYYDLAKFLHTLEFSVQSMEQRLFEVNHNASGHYSIDHKVGFQEVVGQECFWAFAREHRYERRRIEVINALIYINMAPLYDSELGLYLYLLGRYRFTLATLDQST